MSPADLLWTPPFTPMKAANGVFVLSVEHDVVSCMPEGILGRKATVGDMANPEG